MEAGLLEATFSCLALTDGLCQVIADPGVVAIGTSVKQQLVRCVAAIPMACWSFFCVTICFGTKGEEDLLGNRWTQLWMQQP